MTQLRRGEYHAFDGAGARYLYLVPSAAVVRMDDTSQAVLDAVSDREVPIEELTASLSEQWPATDVRDAYNSQLNSRTATNADTIVVSDGAIKTPFFVVFVERAYKGTAADQLRVYLDRFQPASWPTGGL